MTLGEKKEGLRWKGCAFFKTQPFFIVGLRFLKSAALHNSRAAVLKKSAALLKKGCYCKKKSATLLTVKVYPRAIIFPSLENFYERENYHHEGDLIRVHHHHHHCCPPHCSTTTTSTTLRDLIRVHHHCCPPLLPTTIRV